MELTNDQYNLSDFIILNQIGSGTYSNVFLVKYKNELYAMKVMDKLFLLKENQIKHIKTEKEILMTFKNPFINRMNFYFQDNHHMYFLLEYIPGGELFSRLRSMRIFTTDMTLFYASEVLVALLHLHENNMIYRDLKPENILIDKDGHLVLIDFGFSKRINSNEKTYTFCGTPEYLAPEILKKVVGYSYGIDYWAFGVLLYEMMVGKPPFWDKEPYGIFEKIEKNEPVFPKNLNIKAKDLITKLLDKNEETRLGVKDKGLSIKKHSFFQYVDWDKISEKKIDTPWKPLVEKKNNSNNINMQHFEILFKEKNDLPLEFESYFKDF